MGENMKLHNRKPDIENLYKVLRGEEPSRPTMYELYMNLPLYERLAGRKLTKGELADETGLEYLKLVIEAYNAAGYDYAPASASDFGFKTERRQEKSTISLNEGFVITDEASYEKYSWPNAEDFDYSRLEKIRPCLPDGMKLSVGTMGVLENVIALAGYENLCFMLYDNPGLAKAVFDQVGERLFKYYETVLEFDTVGLIVCSDDWGFKHETFLSPADMRKYVFPWHKKYVDLAHGRKIPAMLHSCGYAVDIMDDIINFMGFDGKHSFEDAIVPVEDSYESYQGRIAVLGGIDLNFVISRSEEEITARCRAMIKRSEGRGGYALGTGNSVPEYVPQEHFITLLKAALEY